MFVFVYSFPVILLFQGIQSKNLQSFVKVLKEILFKVDFVSTLSLTCTLNGLLSCSLRIA